jgi:hypothetical protein
MIFATQILRSVRFASILPLMREANSHSLNILSAFLAGFMIPWKLETHWSHGFKVQYHHPGKSERSDTFGWELS